MIRLSAIAVGLTALLIALVAAAPAFAGVWAWLLVAAIHSVFTPIQARVGLSFPKHLTGRALTAYNLMVFVPLSCSATNAASDGHHPTQRSSSPLRSH